MPRVAAIILAAGQATRFGGPTEETKLAADFEGRALIRHVAEAALGSRARPVLIVTGHAADLVRSLVKGLDLRPIHNFAYAEGISASLKTGIMALPADVRGALILLGDMPLVTTALIDRIIAAFELAPVEPDAVVPVRGGRRGNPVLIGCSLFPRIGGLQGDRGAKDLLKDTSLQVIECPIADTAVEIDVDTPEALAELRGHPTP